METIPACALCHRSTKTCGPNKGEPIRIIKDGPNAGLCKSCQRRSQPAYQASLSDREVITEQQVDAYRSALEYWLDNFYRPRRRVNVPLSR